MINYNFIKLIKPLAPVTKAKAGVQKTRYQPELISQNHI